MDRAFLTDIDGVTEVFLVRHGQQRFPDDIRSATPDMWRDPPLTDLGEQQAAAAGRHLAGERLDIVYSSELARAYDTGAAIAAAHDVEQQVVSELAEIHMFRDLPPGTTAMDAVGPLLLAGYRERFARVRRWDVYPHTETSLDFRRRVNGAIEGIIDQHQGECVAIACHGGVINAYLTEILGLDEDMFFRPAHASVHRVFAHGDRRVIQTLNEVSHLLSPDDLLTY
jgi:broad specificity phosphatase PhoE